MASRSTLSTMITLSVVHGILDEILSAPAESIFRGLCESARTHAGEAVRKWPTCELTPQDIEKSTTALTRFEPVFRGENNTRRLSFALRLMDDLGQMIHNRERVGWIMDITKKLNEAFLESADDVDPEGEFHAANVAGGMWREILVEVLG